MSEAPEPNWQIAIGELRDAHAENANAIETIRASVEEIAGRFAKIESALAWAEQKRLEREAARKN